MKLTRQEQKAITRQRLLAAAARVVRREGWERASTEQIAVEAGLTRGALYSCFEDRDDLLVTLLATELSSFEPSTAWPAADDLEGLLDGLCSVMTQQGVAELTGNLLTSSDIFTWALRNERARQVLAAHYRAALGDLADRLADNDAGAAPMELALLLAALATGFAQLQVLLGPGTATPEVLRRGVGLLTKSAQSSSWATR